jgi:hypothetical protein
MQAVVRVRFILECKQNFKAARKKYRKYGGKLKISPLSKLKNFSTPNLPALLLEIS